MLPKIIGVVGKIHSGKDTIADYICTRHKYMKAGFADPLKYVCAELFMDEPKKFFSEEGKNEIMKYWGITRRAALQFVGTELVRNNIYKLPGYLINDPTVVAEDGSIRSDHWIRCMEKRIHDTNIPLIIINDTRFQNELDWIYSQGGWILHTTRNVIDINPNVAAGIPHHSSEDTESLKLNGDKTWRIDNSETKEQLYSQLDKFISQFI